MRNIFAALASVSLLALAAPAYATPQTTSAGGNASAAGGNSSAAGGSSTAFGGNSSSAGGTGISSAQGGNSSASSISSGTGIGLGQGGTGAGGTGTGGTGNGGTGGTASDNTDVSAYGLSYVHDAVSVPQAVAAQGVAITSTSWQVGPIFGWAGQDVTYLAPGAAGWVNIALAATTNDGTYAGERRQFAVIAVVCATNEELARQLKLGCE